MRDSNDIISYVLIPCLVICMGLGMIISCVYKTQHKLDIINKHLEIHHKDFVNHAKESSHTSRMIEHFIKRSDSNCFECHYPEEE
jgi:hypothetical protein